VGYTHEGGKPAANGDCNPLKTMHLPRTCYLPIKSPLIPEFRLPPVMKQDFERPQMVR